MSVLRVMNSQGDKSMEWEVTNPDSVKEAQTRFDELMKKGGLAFLSEGGESERITSFRPEAKEIVIVPAIAGGE